MIFLNKILFIYQRGGNVPFYQVQEIKDFTGFRFRKQLIKIMVKAPESTEGLINFIIF